MGFLTFDILIDRHRKSGYTQGRIKTKTLKMVLIAVTLHMYKEIECDDH